MYRGIRLKLFLIEPEMYNVSRAIIREKKIYFKVI